MASDEDEKRRQEEESRIREILGTRSAEDPKKLELDKKRTEAENQRKTGNFGLVLLILVVLSALFAAVRFLLGG